jgi:hypothetical protein
MSERRNYYRVSAFARVGLRAIDPDRVEMVRLQIRARSTPGALAPGPFEDARLEVEQKATIELLQRISYSLDRIEYRLEDILLHQRGSKAWFSITSHPVEITLSGSGLSGCFELPLSPGDLAEVTLDIWGAGLPLIYAVARVVDTKEAKEGTITALNFEELTPEDRERIVQFTIRSQSRGLRDRQTEES